MENAELMHTCDYAGAEDPGDQPSEEQLSGI